MGFWDATPRSPSPTRSHHSSSSRHHTSSGRRASGREPSSSSNYYASYSPFNMFTASSSTSRGYGSSSRARPRSGLMARLRRWLRQLYDYMRANPVKVFMLVLMPLITGGALSKILARFGVRLPAGLEALVGGGGRNAGGGGLGGILGGGGGGSGSGSRYYARGGARDLGAGSSLPGMSGGLGESLQGALKIASMFV